MDRGWTSQIHYLKLEDWRFFVNTRIAFYQIIGLEDWTHSLTKLYKQCCFPPIRNMPKVPNTCGALKRIEMETEMMVLMDHLGAADCRLLYAWEFQLGFSSKQRYVSVIVCWPILVQASFLLNWLLLCLVTSFAASYMHQNDDLPT